jgi:hypothetical protein
MATATKTEITAEDVAAYLASHRDPRWEALTARFPEEWIEKLPKQIRKDDNDKGTCVQGSKYSADGVFCGKYHARSVHLDYVGHAGLTMRLNEAVGPENWDWTPMAFHPSGTPGIIEGGMWIELTILGVTKKGYGDAQGKTGHNATKEIIGDALRNAALRFGVGTYLWSKSEHASNLHVDPEETSNPQIPGDGRVEENRTARLLDEARNRILQAHIMLKPDLSPDARNKDIVAMLVERGYNSLELSDLNDLAAEIEMGVRQVVADAAAPGTSDS